MTFSEKMKPGSNFRIGLALFLAILSLLFMIGALCFVFIGDTGLFICLVGFVASAIFSRSLENGD